MDEPVADAGELEGNLRDIAFANARLGGTAPVVRALPPTVTDPDQTWSNTGSQQFDHYHGSNAFRAAPSQVALGQDQAGNLLVAGVVYYGTIGNLDPNCYIAVAKINTEGTKVADVFYVAEADGGKIEPGKRTQEVREGLLQALRGLTKEGSA